MSTTARMRPVRAHDLLLRAALHPDPDTAAAARREWAAGANLDSLDLGALQLLPLLAADPARLGDGPLATQVGRVVRFSWLRTQMLSRMLADPLRALADAGLDPLLSKGGSLVHAHGIPIRLRPMFDIDVAVPVRSMQRAHAVLKDAGYSSPMDGVMRTSPERLATDTHATEYADARGVKVDLHWHLLHRPRHPALDARFREGAVPCVVAGQPALATGLEDTLVIVVSHGSRWARGAAVRWVGDLALILQRHGRVLDWDAVVRRSREARLSRTVVDALDYVADVSGLAAPAEARRALLGTSTPVAVRLRRAARDDPDGGPRRSSRLRRLAEDYEEHVSSVLPLETRTRPADAARYLARRWDLPSARAVPVHAAWVAAGRPWALRRFGWALTGTSFASSGDRPRYAVGQVVRFAAGEAGGGFLRGGWWHPEPHGVWARVSAPTVVLDLDGAMPADDGLELRLGLVAMLSPRHRELPLEVVVNGVRVARQTLMGDAFGPHEVATAVPLKARKDHERLAITLVAPTISPADARVSPDQRAIGIGLAALWVGVPEQVPGSSGTAA